MTPDGDIRDRTLDDRRLLRLAGWAAAGLVGAYVLITGLYVWLGSVPSGDGAAWLAYLDGKEPAWWAITGLSVLTDVLFLPIAAAMVVALRSDDHAFALLGSGLLALFAVLDLAVTWPNYAALITLSAEATAAAGPAEGAAFEIAANAPAGVLMSELFPVYVIAIPSLGILALGVAMRRSIFGSMAAWLGIATGVLGMVAVLGGFVVDSLSALAILTSILTTVWVALVGYRLFVLGRPPAIG